MDSAVQAFLDMLNRTVGFPNNGSTVTWFTVAFFALIAAIKLWWSSRKSRKEFERIAEELRRTTGDVSGHMREQFDGQMAKLEKVQSSIQRTVNRKVRGVEDILKEYMRPTTQVAALIADPEITEEDKERKPSKRTRLKLSESVRSTVMAKWLEGRTLRRSEQDPNIYEFGGHSESGRDYWVLLHTPYRSKLGEDGRMPFVLEIWMDDRKHLNFEWDTDGKYALRGFKRGDWIEDVTEWRLHHGAAQQVA